MDLPINGMVMFHSYVSLPEGICKKDESYDYRITLYWKE